MSNSRDRGSGRDVSNDEGRSISVSSVGSAGARKKKRFVAPKCNYGIHAILFMSSTQSNPNMLFFGCPNFKTAESHCKYFLWLDKYVSLFEEEQIKDDNLYGRNPKQNHLLDAVVSMEEKVTKLEDRVSGLELQMKNSRHVKCNRGFSYSLMAVVFVFGVVFANYLR
ncbi:uncharacterized protein LOC110269547 [Arachis ipaensis]|uniref:Zinc finger GRF-type domain-containing protein n=1 Tax=Arachis hypogaea TaxID=3818 RepID=A0A445DLN3_ARAHY|nr:uncharacterized protein LOC110269547 [Arachis ipaensis]QHO60213.1 uncharacterized protein DS421_3g105540 [Arachis hypogaea]RYR64141.1 hypothetical protein Ahy_A03g010277 [Arachis hypogaea]